MDEALRLRSQGIKRKREQELKEQARQTRRRIAQDARELNRVRHLEFLNEAVLDLERDFAMDNETANQFVDTYLPSRDVECSNIDAQDMEYLNTAGFVPRYFWTQDAQSAKDPWACHDVRQLAHIAQISSVDEPKPMTQRQIRQLFELDPNFLATLEGTTPKRFRLFESPEQPFAAQFLNDIQSKIESKIGSKNQSGEWTVTVDPASYQRLLDDMLQGGFNQLVVEITTNDPNYYRPVYAVVSPRSTSSLSSRRERETTPTIYASTPLFNRLGGQSGVNVRIVRVPSLPVNVPVLAVRLLYTKQTDLVESLMESPEFRQEAKLALSRALEKRPIMQPGDPVIVNVPLPLVSSEWQDEGADASMVRVEYVIDRVFVIPETGDTSIEWKHPTTPLVARVPPRSDSIEEYDVRFDIQPTDLSLAEYLQDRWSPVTFTRSEPLPSDSDNGDNGDNGHDTEWGEWD